MTRVATVLVIDDERDLRELLAHRLAEEGFVVRSVATGAEGLAQAGRETPGVVILDWGLPDMPGTEVVRRLRGDPGLRMVPILMLTARGEEVDRVVGLELGADDFVVKPFSVRELVLRVRSLARRQGPSEGGDKERVLRWRGLAIDPTSHRVTVDEVEVSLTPLEFKLLLRLVAQPGRAFTRERLLDDVWNVTADVTTRTVDTHVKRLREKLGAYGDAIETVRGIGYRLKQA